MPIYKPSTRKGPVFLAPENKGAPVIIGPDGTKYTGVPANQRGGLFYNEGNYQWVFPNQVIGLQDAKIQFGDETGNIANGAQDWRGDLKNWVTTGKGSIGDPGSQSFGVPGQFAPGAIGYGSTPAYIGGMFPTVGMSPLAPYSFTDPMKFAQKFGAFNRKEAYKNFDVSKDLALKEVSTELSALQGFVPAAAALKRNETSLDNEFARSEIAKDNAFNQNLRTDQVNAVLPNARADLDAQRTRANSFANGRVPDAIQDRALELGVRSASADRSAAGGFGAQSSVARKASDLLSVNERINLSKYGDSLLSGNINQEANLFLSPAEYSKAQVSNAGSQINVNPSVSVSQLIDRNIAQINGLASIPASQALGSNVQQNQFRTQQTQQNSQFNTTAQNQFALDLFGYNAAYANSVAGAAQTNTNTGIALDQQAMAQQITQQYMELAQEAQQLQSIFTGVGGLFQSLGGLKGIVGAFSGLFGGGGVGPSATAQSIFGINSGGSQVGSVVGTGVGEYFGGPGGAAVGSQIGAVTGDLVQDVGSEVIDSVGSVS